MDAKRLWQRYQDWLYYHPGLALYLDISRMGFDESFVESMQPKLDKAWRDVAALEKGDIANPDEGRMVGHYWLRDASLAPTPAIRQEIVETIEQIEVLVKKIHSGSIKPPQAPRFTDILSIGIGGSALGPQFVADALASDFPLMDIHFIDNSDPAGIDRCLTKLKNRLNSTLVLVISKSGGTPEPRNAMLEVQKVYTDHQLNFAQQAIAITGVGSLLDKQAIAENWLARLPMPDWVGGRTSELSVVGLFPAALQGIDIHAMLAGAQEMDVATRIPSLKNNPAALLALSWYHAGKGRGEKDMVILPYKDRLILFSRYLQQLVMESLGKEKDLNGQIVNQGIAVYGNKGSTDQHAYVQQLREGVPNFFVTFIEVLHDRATESPQIEPDITTGDYLSGFLQGTRQALYEKQRESITVTISEVNAKTVGALIALYERAVSLYGSLVNINAYHQPGVEAGKKAASSILQLQKRVIDVLKAEPQPLSLNVLAEKVGTVEEIETIYKIVRHLAANNRGIVCQGNPAILTSLKVSYAANS